MMPRAKKEQEPVVQPHQLGDKICWKGIYLTVTAVHADGRVEAMTQTMRVTVDGHDEFEKVTNYGG